MGPICTFELLNSIHQDPPSLQHLLEFSKTSFPRFCMAHLDGTSNLKIIFTSGLLRLRQGLMHFSVSLVHR